MATSRAGVCFLGSGARPRRREGLRPLAFAVPAPSIIVFAALCFPFMSYHLTPHFALEEFFESPTARARKICNLPASPAELARVLDNLAYLADGLEMLRSKLDRALRVNSGYRCPLLNNAVGGVSNSRHLQGCAADIAAEDVDGLASAARELGIFTKILPYPDRYFVHLERVQH